MKAVSQIMQFLAAALVTVAVASAQEQQECVVGGNGECVNTVQATSGGEEIIFDENCPDRGHIIRRAGVYLDSNKNGKLDRAELDDAIASLPW
jgi:hypothetical protein